MAAASIAAGEKFDKWLKIKLSELNTDENIFGSYIRGILEGDESIEEKQETLEGILSEIIVSRTKKHLVYFQFYKYLSFILSYFFIIQIKKCMHQFNKYGLWFLQINQ